MNEKNEKQEKKIMELKPGMENVNVTVRVLEAGPPKVIQTRKGPRTISEAIVGDETGRAKMTLWGSQAGAVEEGKPVRIEGAWTTSYRGQVILNVGARSSITEVGEEEAPQPEEVPEKSPTAPREYRSSSGQYRKQYRGRRSY